MLSTSEEIFRASNPGVIRIYDAQNDNFRNALQADLDLALIAAANGAKVREYAEKLSQEYRSTAAAVRDAREATPYG